MSKIVFDQSKFDPSFQLPFFGRAALVTGGASGIGAAVVRSLARGGADVAFSYRSSEGAAHQLVSDLAGLGRHIFPLKADLASAGSAEDLVAEAVEKFGRLDILVNNAAVGAAGRIENFRSADLDAILAVNVRAPFQAIRCALGHMGDGGRIINIGSVSSDYMPYGGHSAYVTSKAALQGMTRGMTRELAERGISINVVQPGRIETAMLHEALGSEFERIRKSTPLGRFGEAEEVAALVAFLCTPEAGYITGASMRADGGVSV